MLTNRNIVLLCFGVSEANDDRFVSAERSSVWRNVDNCLWNGFGRRT